MHEAMQEVIRLANLEGVPLPRDNDEQFLRTAMPTFNPDGMPSMRQDVLAKRPTEVEEFAGVVRARAKKHGMPHPRQRLFLCPHPGDRSGLLQVRRTLWT